MPEEKIMEVISEEEIGDLGETSDQESESVTSDANRKSDNAIEESATSDEPKPSVKAEEIEGEAATPEEEPEIPGEKPKKKSGVQERIDELTHDKGELARERDYYRELVLKAKEPETPAVETSPEPQYDDFDTVEAYTKAFVEWKFKDSEKNTAQISPKDLKESIKTELRMEQNIESKKNEGRNKYSDFDKIALNEDIKYSETMNELVLESSMTADLAYYFGVNPDEAIRVSELTPKLCAKEIGKIEAALEQAFAEAEVHETQEEVDLREKRERESLKRISKTPVPIRVVGRSDSVRVDDEKLSTAEYAKRHGLALPWKT